MSKEIPGNQWIHQARFDELQKESSYHRKMFNKLEEAIAAAETISNSVIENSLGKVVIQGIEMDTSDFVEIWSAGLSELVNRKNYSEAEYRRFEKEITNLPE